MLCLRADNCNILGASASLKQGPDVPHVFCPRRGPGASFKTARVMMRTFDYGKGTFSERSGGNNTEICVGI